LIVVDFLVDEPLLLVFIVVGVGAACGTVSIRGVSIGPAAALFVGLGVGAIDERLSGVGELGVVRELGLVLFTYTLGLASGPSFFAALRRGGAAAIAVTGALVGVLAVMTAVVAAAFGLTAADRAGVFAGATTNTPALQAAVEAVDDGDPVVGYSLSYPAAVLAMLVVLTLLLGRRLPLPASLEPTPAPPPEPLINWTVRIERDDLPPLGRLRERYPGLGFSRIEHAGVVSVARADDAVDRGDLLVVVGPGSVVEAFCRDTGARSDHHLPLDRSSLDFRRVVVSNRRVAGARVGELGLEDRFGVSVTRIRRGDVDLLVSDTTRLALGDRLRVVGPHAALTAVARELGDSERSLSELDAAGFAIGITIGLAIGTIAAPLPGGGELHLGAGGGTLVAGLVLGMVSRVGPLTFQLPYAASLVLRQLGVLVFLAAAGIGSGSTFADAIGTGEGLELIVVGAIVATGFALVVPLVVEVLLRRDVVDTAGFFAGVETQPAALAYVLNRTAGDERVNVAYALAFPAAMIAKIIAVQFLV
jgi:putative transport protein